MISLDTETTGLDLRHGARPFLVTMCNEQGETTYWLWEVDPLTRMPVIPEADVYELCETIEEADALVLQNPKFDVAALESIGVDTSQWPWEKTYDTLLAGHLLASNEPHDLTWMTSFYLGVDIEPLERKLKKAVEEARRIARRDHKDWLIAKKGLPGMPSAKDKVGGFDYWLPYAIAEHDKYPANHPWRTVLIDYANTDSAATLPLFKRQMELLKERGLWKIYLERLKVLPVAYSMESVGITLSKTRLVETREQFRGESIEAGEACVRLAKEQGYDLTLPKSSVNGSLRTFLLDKLKLPPIKWSKKTFEPSLDKATMEHWDVSLPTDSVGHRFVKFLMGKRKRDTAISYMDGYEKFWLPLEEENWYRLHPSLNPTGSDTLRWSSSSPNEQNICVDPETEFLTGEGWVRADHLKHTELIAQFWKDTGTIDFANAKVWSPLFKGNMVKLTTEQQIDMLLTPNHRCLLEDRKTGKRFDVLASNFKSDHKHLQAGKYVGGDSWMTEYEVAWLCAVQADGSYCKTDGEEYGIRFILTKTRKIERLKWCLSGLGAKWSERTTQGRTSFYLGKNEPAVLMAKSKMPNKRLGSWLLDMNVKTLNAFQQEFFMWDGDSIKKGMYSSSDKESADWVQIVNIMLGNRSWIRSGTPKSGWAVREHHWVNITQGQNYSLTSNVRKELVPWNGPVYCVTVPSSYVITRRNGKVSITGNSKQEGFNLRRVFGPAPGREWWSLDAKNIELRIPAYEAGETEMVALFERPDDPPYYGSYHMLIFALLHPEKFAKYGMKSKEVFASTWYQYTKNGNFATQYGAIEASGTADRAYHLPGAQRRIKERFSNITKLNDRMIAFADRYGYVETIPDRSIGAKRGYPLLCTRTGNGRVLPTVPLNYHVQGCLAGDSRVFTDQGMIPIRELVGKTTSVWNGFKWCRAVGLNRGPSKRASISTESGLRIECDVRHKLKNENDEWVPFDKMKVGDLVALPRAESPIAASGGVNWWFVFGFIIGDGCLMHRGNRRILTICVGTLKKELLETVYQFLRDCGYTGNKTKYRDRGGVRWTVIPANGPRKEKYMVTLENREFADFLEESGFDFNWKSDTKRLPESVWRADTNAQRDFMEGVWMSDGNRACTSGSGKFLNMKNENLLSDIQKLAWALGYDAFFRGSRLLFRWNSFGAKSTRNYPHGSLSKKVRHIDRSKYLDDNQFITDSRALCKALRGEDVSQYLAERLLERNVGTDGIYRYDKIVSIDVSSIVEDTYTMSVDDPSHQFVADGVIHPNTAMWWMQKAMVRCYEYLRSLGDSFRLIMQVHDELVFDLPKGRGEKPWLTNYPKIRKVKSLMEEGGNDIGIPTPVSVTYHEHSWSEGVSV